MDKPNKSWSSLLLLFAATNFLAVGIILILSGIYFAVYWYWNLDLGKAPGILALISMSAVNVWLLFRWYRKVW
jgi:uncharacterized membrane protein YphA (DoxX/SURF4 family)